MRSTTDPHNTLWTRADRNPVTLAQIGRLGPGLRYGVRPLEVETNNRGAHMAERVVMTRLVARGARGIVGREWLSREDQKLLEWRDENVTWSDIAERLGRTGAACEKRAAKLRKVGRAKP